MTPDTLERIILIALFIMGFLLWLDSPMGQPRGSIDCGIKGCRVHRKDGK